MVFIAAGMGGGTGTGAAYVVAREARDCGVLSIAVVTKPFQFEGAKRLRNAEAGIAELRKYADTLLVIPNENLFRIATDRTTFADAFVMADQVMYSGIVTITDLIMKEGLINLDLADVKAVLGGMGRAMMGMGEAVGEQRAIAAAEEAIVNPLLDEVTLKGAKSLLLCITGGRDMTLWEVEEAASRVCQEVDPDANIIVGATFDDGLGDRIRVSIVASGMPRTAALPEPDHDADLPAWTPRSQREGAGEPYGRRMADAAGGRRGLWRGAACRQEAAPGQSGPPARAMPRSAMAGDRGHDRRWRSEARAGLDGLSALPKTPARPRKGGGGGRRPGEAGPKRPPTLPDGVEVGEARRRTRRTAADGHPPPVNWRELTAPEEEPPARPSPPVNWRERAAHSNGSARSDPEYDGSIVPEREPEPPARKVGFFERLGFGRRRA